jgi:hypothetical protein
MTRRTLAAVAAAVAVAIPTASASAATPPAVVPYTPPITLCEAFSVETQQALAVGNQLLADLLTQTSVDVLGCGGAAL